MELKVLLPEWQISGLPVILKSGISFAGELELLGESLVKRGIPVGISQLRGCNEHGSHGLAHVSFERMVRAFGEDCVKFQKTLADSGYKGPYLIGAYSFGAAVALRLCQKIKLHQLLGFTRPSALVLMAPGICHRNPYLRELIRRRRLPPQDELNFIFGKTLSKLGDRQVLEEAKNYVPHKHVLLYGKKYRDTPSTTIRTLAEGMGKAWRIYTSGLDIPIYVATAEHDHHVPPKQVRQVNLPNLHFWESFDTGHCLPLERTEELAARIAEVSVEGFSN